MFATYLASGISAYAIVVMFALAFLRGAHGPKR